jgi:molybdenum cofactor synthesis domain-containing protein
MPDNPSIERTAVVIVSSDRAHQGVYQDQTGPAAQSWLEDHGFHIKKLLVVPDLEERLLDALENSHQDDVSLIVVSGGTGIGPRDRTPQVVNRYADYEIPGFGEFLRMESHQLTPKAYISRCGAWVIGSQLILALAGSPKATREQLEILKNLLPLALDALRDQCDHRRHKKDALS